MNNKYQDVKINNNVILNMEPFTGVDFSILLTIGSTSEKPEINLEELEKEFNTTVILTDRKAFFTYIDVTIMSLRIKCERLENEIKQLHADGTRPYNYESLSFWEMFKAWFFGIDKEKEIELKQTQYALQELEQIEDYIKSKV